MEVFLKLYFIFNKVKDVTDCNVELVWDPPWTQDKMTEAARLELGLFY